MTLRATLTAVLFSLTLVSALGWAHPYHTSFAEIEWNSDGTTLEVSLRVLPEDFEQALSWHAGNTIALEQQALATPVIQSYLNQHFQIVSTPSSSDSKAVNTLTLEGYEVAYDETWLYFVVSASRDSSLALRNTLMMEVNDTQTNRVQRLWREPSDVLIYTASKREQPL
ncbi:MAG: DUF6702 family protein [Halioglobus sp.]